MRSMRARSAGSAAMISSNDLGPLAPSEASKTGTPPASPSSGVQWLRYMQLEVRGHQANAPGRRGVPAGRSHPFILEL
jgi:hypothetical protein